uniref:Uncharacterized protein AlNc14C36G3169 n=1 Tax=Albugo laibachii Nc14 TaxID=890382 RepID=F0W8P3_9STRA|nr:conserved hypothetical protein [Albugo laibachii Nc14]|eukprot:CCA17500.1 conserved hypothetical protein [Albugo laibachii Nc14]
MSNHERNRAIFHALSYIDSLKADAELDTENIEVGVQCLTEAFKLNLHDAQQQELYLKQESLNASFEKIFTAGLKSSGLLSAESQFSTEQDPIIKKNPELWSKWVKKLEEKGFFSGAAVGSKEYHDRMAKALGKFKAKFGDVRVEECKPQREFSEAIETKANEMKNRGNAALNAGDYQLAAKHYREALELSPNGPSSHIYHSNLAASLMYMQKFDEAISHCEAAIAIDPKFLKAYNRMGAAQIQLKDYQGAIDSFRRGLEIDESNAPCKAGLEEAEKLLQQSQSAAQPSSARTPAGGMPDLSSLAGMLGGGGGGLAGLLNNPAMQQMASSMMQNPQMMQMAQNLMQNPSMLGGMLGQMGNGGNNAAPPAAESAPASFPGRDALINNPQVQAARSDPDMQDFFRDLDADGPSAVMRHTSNPKVATLVQNVMGNMQS